MVCCILHISAKCCVLLYTQISTLAPLTCSGPLNSLSFHTGANKENLVINPGSFSSNHGYTFKLTVTDPVLGVSGYSKLVMGPNRPPDGGSCHVTNPGLSVVALERQLEIWCTGWTDPDEQGDGALMYKVGTAWGTMGTALMYKVGTA